MKFDVYNLLLIASLRNNKGRRGDTRKVSTFEFHKSGVEWMFDSEWI